MSYAYVNNPAYHAENEELKSIYNKWRQRQFGKRIPVHVFGSGSEGNSVYLKPHHTLIDLGLTFKSYQEYSPTFFLDVDYLIITHHHGDHLNPATLHRVLCNYPHIKVIMSEFMWKMITSDDYKPEYKKRKKGEIIPFGHDPLYQTDNSGRRIKKPSKWANAFLLNQSRVYIAEAQTLVTHDGKKFLFEPLTVKHGDIVNIAVQISDPELEFEFLYASDLDNLGGERTFTDCYGNIQHVTGLDQKRRYTCMFLEANYDETILQNWYNNLSEDDPNYRGKKARADGNLRHISEQEASVYIEQHLDENGLFVPLHASKTFGTLHQS
ncbi:hypothetical protein JUJ52_03065 [Virgibacillus sp. AGTR]|uniref:hypothetical protein n=1 Tax=Virgibacillus sp. AGTR TaxID=2812055 RepID=UPI001D1659B2|nr:hypothetical protein [Virgibacillus sp. AGTR]MCC2248938.1 hypothetical protein [Virgibacillus sp. AGTR]